ncbi:hypothetical protein SeMB42_g01997 [Synchytrium endobioticum]|uniref:Protein kinase domain-containing protein n=1 Tax=Synchytrium endobioticum TaxID=286115 RepID=A0A507D013_9FUNG|nr:hypothetical protein SeLEV6574_g04290 [Synchytrium endobioticum]TPX51231.1 hypothetical protein SeMB42_g01997 [Synchytrium endobioticum]
MAPYKLEQLLAKYELGETLGTGAFSEVKTAIERSTKNKFAIKIIDKAKCKGKESMIETEVDILKRVKHDNIIQLYEMYEIDSKIYLVMELVTGGELFDHIVSRGKYTEGDAAKIVFKILLAIEYLHSLGIAHRDLKPENLLLSDKSKQAKIMISDFGLSKVFDDDEVMRTACGTPGYVAPEVLRRQGYSKEIDLWSLGVITYILLSGYPPFYDQNNVELFKQIMTGKYEFDRPWWDNVSESAKDFIRHLLVLEPRQRYTAQDALAHPFIVNNCGTADEYEAARSHTSLHQVKAHCIPPKHGSHSAWQAEDIEINEDVATHQGQQPQPQQQQQQQVNLAPTVQANLNRVYSKTGSMKSDIGAEDDSGYVNTASHQQFQQQQQQAQYHHQQQQQQYYQQPQIMTSQSHASYHQQGSAASPNFPGGKTGMWTRLFTRK